MNHANLWAPWRMAYLRSIADVDDNATASAQDSNFFRRYWLEPDKDEENLVVYRNDAGMILLNRYPYANGHVLVALGEARGTFDEFNPEQLAAFWSLLEKATKLVRTTLNPQGLNVGINEGDAAGAGVPEHLHAHVVPRWRGDTNFMMVIGGVRVAPDALESVARAYRESIAAGALD